jgi:hypothetical protein
MSGVETFYFVGVDSVGLRFFQQTMANRSRASKVITCSERRMKAEENLPT